MPIYEYQCPECANIFEVWAKASEMQELAPCPLCATPSERIISHTAFVLKGGGWYVTDYGYRKNVSEDSAAASHAGGAPGIPASATHPDADHAEHGHASAHADHTEPGHASASPHASADPAQNRHDQAAPQNPQGAGNAAHSGAENKPESSPRQKAAGPGTSPHGAHSAQQSASASQSSKAPAA